MYNLKVIFVDFFLFNYAVYICIINSNIYKHFSMRLIYVLN